MSSSSTGHTLSSYTAWQQSNIDSLTHDFDLPGRRIAHILNVYDNNLYDARNYLADVVWKENIKDDQLRQEYVDEASGDVYEAYMLYQRDRILLKETSVLSTEEAKSFRWKVYLKFEEKFRRRDVPWLIDCYYRWQHGKLTLPDLVAEIPRSAIRPSSGRISTTLLVSEL